MRLFLSTVLALLLLACSGNENPSVDSQTNKIDTIGVLWERVHHCSKLEVAEYTVLKIVSFDDKSQLKFFGYSTPLPGEKKLMIPIEVKMKVTVDLSFVTRNDISINDSTINITLPSPILEITSTKIDHDKSRESVSWYRSNFTEEEREYVIKQGIEDVKKSTSYIEINNIAQSNTENVLQPILVNAGIKQHLNITFKNPEIKTPNFKD
ncbi:MAG: DUF4230 domain-containing protein [Paludibacteraceae bacterium]|nr:DUF4230 domain-containing protein [Paludibacteraceae bacterium]